MQHIDQKSIEKCKETIARLKIPEVDDFGVNEDRKDDRKEWC